MKSHSQRLQSASLLGVAACLTACGGHDDDNTLPQSALPLAPACRRAPT